jgi:hypothetical protein
MTIAAEVERARDGREIAADAGRFVDDRRQQERRLAAEAHFHGLCGRALKYRQKCDEVAALGDDGFTRR